MGHGKVPNYIKNKICLEALEHPPGGNTSYYYTDNLCAFRCLGLHNGHGNRQLARSVNLYYTQWRKYNSNTIPKKAREYKEVDIEDLPAFECCFEILNIQLD